MTATHERRPAPRGGPAGDPGAPPVRNLLRKAKRRLPPPLRAAGLAVVRSLALAHRVGLLGRVTFVGVTGSTGKTTTKDLIHAILSSRLAGRKSEGNSNVTVHWTVLRARPWHRYCVQEIAAAIQGRRIPLERPLALVRPRIGVVTNIGTDHLSAFGSVGAIAAEKGKLVEALPEAGAAILNADDPNVAAMAARCRARVVTHGLAAHATLRAENISASWPDRLSFDLVCDGQRHAVRTRLCGAHWVPCVLAAIGAAREMGIPLAAAARAVGTAAPSEGRMEPVPRPDGVTFVRDDVKAPLWSVGPALDFVRGARAPRRIVVIGTISDYAGNSTTVYCRVARQALDAADLVLVVGSKSAKCSKVRKGHPKGDALQLFYSLEAAAEYLRGELRPGDLVLLKGISGVDGLSRLCAVGDGARPAPRPRAGGTSPLASSPWETPRPERRPPPVRVVVGLGNAGARYADTPHNVGHRVLDALAVSLGRSWEACDGALTLAAGREGGVLHLIKPMVDINDSGRVVRRLRDEFGFAAAECLLVHDDLDLPLGIVRVREGGGDGGHRGVRSVLRALGTDAVARLKVGIGRPEPGGRAADHVLRPFSPAELAEVGAASAAAAAAVLELVARRTPSPAGRPLPRERSSPITAAHAGVAQG